MTHEFYVGESGHLKAIRQERFRAQLEAGKEHPHDVCALACTVEELKSMVKDWDVEWPAEV